jgi:hypothetical protein
MKEAVSSLSECPNCAAPLAGKFCAACGQKVTPISLAFFAASALPGQPPVFEPADEAEVGPIGALIGLETMSAAEANELVNRAQHDWAPRAMFVLAGSSPRLAHCS